MVGQCPGRIGGDRGERRPATAEFVTVLKPRVHRVVDVEERNHERPELAVFRVRVAADPQDVVGPDDVQVLRIPRDLQFAHQFRVAGVGQVDDEERVDVAERHHVGTIGGEADRIDPFVRCHVFDRTDRDQLIVVLFVDIDAGAGADRGRRDPEGAVRFVHRKAVEEPSGDGPGCDRGEPIGSELEALDQAGVVQPHPRGEGGDGIDRFARHEDLRHRLGHVPIGGDGGTGRVDRNDARRVHVEIRGQRVGRKEEFQPCGIEIGRVGRFDAAVDADRLRMREHRFREGRFDPREVLTGRFVESYIAPVGVSLEGGKVIDQDRIDRRPFVVGQVDRHDRFVVRFSFVGERGIGGEVDHVDRRGVLAQVGDAPRILAGDEDEFIADAASGLVPAAVEGRCDLGGFGRVRDVEGGDDGLAVAVGDDGELVAVKVLGDDGVFDQSAGDDRRLVGDADIDNGQEAGIGEVMFEFAEKRQGDAEIVPAEKLLVVGGGEDVKEIAVGLDPVGFLDAGELVVGPVEVGELGCRVVVELGT